MSSTQPTFEDRKFWQNRPDESPVMFQSWQKLLFLHWRFAPDLIQSMLPAGLTVDTYDNSAWVGVVPFLMRNIRPAWFPSVPYVSNFLELNVRTYACDENGTPGVWFLSLSANRWLAVQLARQLFHLPYFWSQMSVLEEEGGWIDYRCRRFNDPLKQTCRYRYRGIGTPAPAKANTLEFFLVERYILFALLGNGKIATGQVHHTPYEIQQAEVQIQSDQVLKLDRLPLPADPPVSALYSAGVDVEVFGLKTTCDLKA